MLDIYTSQNPSVGNFGGTCTCPSGASFWVGSQDDDCSTLACIGGKSGECTKTESDKWKQKQVVCDYQIPKGRNIFQTYSIPINLIFLLGGLF